MNRNEAKYFSSDFSFGEGRNLRSGSNKGQKVGIP